MEARWLSREDRCWEFPRERSKGKQKARVVLLDDRALEISCRNALKNPQGAMFRNTRGGVWRKQAWVDRCRRLRAKVDFYVSPYAIRHTFATDAILRGVDLVTIAQLMGHVDLRMLSEIYQHVEKHRDHLRQGLEQATGHLKVVG
jgi:site-specific recombinase XerD